MEKALENRKKNRFRIKFHKSTFEKISEERRQKIFNVAISEFASKGYNAANINEIAKKADISIGSMYNYFASKEDLFLAVMDKGSILLEEALSQINIEENDIFEVFEKLLRAARDYAINYPEVNQLYLDATTQGLSSLSSRLTLQLESSTAKLYNDIIRKAKHDKKIDPNIDDRVLSFCFDNLILMFQFSFTSSYYKERMKIFIGSDAMENEERIIQGIISFVKKAISK
ncbi:TetR/AcrR family transcriptional regulator [Brassicibacter mesophilus]|uniref:TetR/AcrR family transcriptional regulator n=1 Tax=Brassicibacter mesophilus TaxID=745119 RepID=UPI003D236F86